MGAAAVISPLASAVSRNFGGTLGEAAGKVAAATSVPKSGLIGTAGGAGGSGFAAPEEVPITGGTNIGQIDQSYAGTQNSLGSQQALLSALQAQNGLSNQSAALGQQQALANQQSRANGVGAQSSALSQQLGLNQQLAANQGAKNVGSAYGQTQALASQLAGSNGVGNLSSALGQQQALARQQQQTAQQYQNIANGVGPNPAQAALNQATGQNVANQAALMAGQRGAGANAGLLARQIAQQGAATQQQAVGQGATLQAQQQLNALQGLSAQQQAIGGTNQNIAGIAGQQIGLTQAQQQALASQAANQVAQQQAGTNAQQQAASNLVGQQQAQQQAIAGQSNALANQQIGATTANTQANQSEQQLLQNALSSQNQQRVAMQGNINSANAGLAQTQLQGQQGLLGGVLNGVGAAIAAAKGGKITTPVGSQPILEVPPQDDESSVGRFLRGWGTGYAAGGQTPSDYTAGGHVVAKTPGQKAVKAGNSYANDKIPALVSEDEIVLPRTVTQSKDPVRSSAQFVAKVLAKRRGGK